MFSSSRNRQPRGSRRSPTPGTGPRKDLSGPPSRSPSPGSPGSKPLYLCTPFADAALVKGNFKTIVMLPKYTDIMEWVAVNSPCFHPSRLVARIDCYLQVFDFYTNLNEFYGVIAETCTQHACPTMTGGPSYVVSIPSLRVADRPIWLD